MRPIPSHTRRRGFTLIELIVVMTIIVVIASLALGVVSKGFGWVKQKNTEQTMTKVITRLQRVIDRLYKEADDWPAHTEGFIVDQANGNMERARVLKVLYLYKWNFPNSYAEAYHNVQESRQLYDNRLVNSAVPADPNNFPGYPPARALLNKLRKGNPAIPDPFSLAFMPAPHHLTFAVPINYQPWAAGTIPNAAMASELPRQSAACMMAAFTTANGTPDEFTNNEVVTGVVDQNPFLTDAWGTPFMFLRHGNFAHSRHRVGGGGVQRPAWTVGMVRPPAIPLLDFAPLEYVLNLPTNLPSNDGHITSGWAASAYLGGYFAQLQIRGNNAYSTLSGRDPLDPTALLKNNVNWRTLAGASTPVASFPIGAGNWMNPAFATWMAFNPDNQHGIWFRCTFGYMPEVANQNYGVPLTLIQNQAYTPMVIISAGGDRIFNQWDDNLDSYRLQIYTGGQQ